MAKMLFGLMENSLKPFGLPFLKLGTMRAWVATLLRLSRTSFSRKSRDTVHSVSLFFWMSSSEGSEAVVVMGRARARGGGGAVVPSPSARQRSK